jgi:hypothetical protein
LLPENSIFDISSMGLQMNKIYKFILFVLVLFSCLITLNKESGGDEACTDPGYPKCMSTRIIKEYSCTALTTERHYCGILGQDSPYDYTDCSGQTYPCFGKLQNGVQTTCNSYYCLSGSPNCYTNPQYDCKELERLQWVPNATVPADLFTTIIQVVSFKKKNSKCSSPIEIKNIPFVSGGRRRPQHQIPPAHRHSNRTPNSTHNSFSSATFKQPHRLIPVVPVDALTVVTKNVQWGL